MLTTIQGQWRWIWGKILNNEKTYTKINNSKVADIDPTFIFIF